MQLSSLGKITMTYLEYLNSKYTACYTFSQVQCGRRPHFKYSKLQTYHSFEVEKLDYDRLNWSKGN